MKMKKESIEKPIETFPYKIHFFPLETRASDKNTIYLYLNYFYLHSVKCIVISKYLRSLAVMQFVLKKF